MKIIQLQAENVKRLSAVNIKPDGSLVVIGGKNGQGKSSVLDSIMYALAGSDSLPSKPLRKGTDKGSVTIDLGDLTVTRKFTRKKDADDVSTSLEIRRANGDKPSSPQALLDQLCGSMAFDPLEFSRMKPKAQLEALKGLVGLDFAEHDRKRQQLFDKRTEVNRQAKAKAAELAACPAVEAPAEEVSVAVLMEELDRRQAVNRAKHEKEVAARDAEQEVRRAADTCRQCQQRIDQLKRELAEAERKLVTNDENRKLLDVQAEDMRREATEMPAEECDPVHAEIKGAEAVNAKVRQNRKRDELKTAHEALEKQSAELTDHIENIDDAKTTALAEAPFPVEGLGFDADGVTLSGLPFSQASSAEQLRVSVAMGLALNPELRVMLIRDGSLLDEDSLAMVAEMAAQKDAQVWIERVGEGEEVSVIIEDGHVKVEAEADKELAAT